MFFAKFFEPKPFNQGYLPEVDGHKVFFWELGNPEGEVILTTHGGPGGFTKPEHVKRFDYKKFRIVMFDQRGCGRSTPLGELKNNNTQKTLEDMERLLDYLGVNEKVVVSGGSWGSTLALLFAVKNPDKVKKMALAKIFIPGERYTKWYEEDAAKLYPDVMDKIKDGVSGDLNTHYLKLVSSDDINERAKAMSLFGSYEWVLGSLEPKMRSSEFSEEERQYFKISLHYNEHNCFLKDGDILNNLKKIAHIPAVIVHNRLDLLCPVDGAWKLHKGMPKSKLFIVPELGHGGALLDEARKREFGKFLG